MGRNVDLCQMIGAPTVLECPSCKRETESPFDDYDIEGGNPNPEPSTWVLHVACRHCEHEWTWKGTVVPEHDEIVAAVTKALREAETELEKFGPVYDYDQESYWSGRADALSEALAVVSPPPEAER